MVVRRGLGADFIKKYCSPGYYGKEGYDCQHFQRVRDAGKEVVCKAVECPHVGKGYIRSKKPLWKKVIFGVPTYAHVSCVAEFYEKAKIVPKKKTEAEK
jgi:hypothetical protein